MKWLVVGLWLIFTAGVLYWIHIKQNVIYIPNTIVLERNEVTDEWQTYIKKSEYSSTQETSAYK